MPSPVVQFRVPPELLARIDDARGDVSRSAWMLAACEHALLPASESEFGTGVQVTADDRAPAGVAVVVSGASAEVVAVPERKAARRPRKPRATDVEAGLVTRAEKDLSSDQGLDYVPPPRCAHSGTRIIGGWCVPCGRTVRPGGG